MKKTPTRILLIEGDADAASLIGSYLAGAPGTEGNPAVTHAPRLSTALHLLAKQDFDAALLDLALPQSGGLEGFLKLQTMRPALPVVILTGQTDEALAARAVRLGAQDYFIKGSADCGLLKRAVRYAIDGKRLAGELEELLAADRTPRLVLDAGRVVRFANAAVHGALGRAPGELLEKPFGAPLPDGDAELTVKTAWTRERTVGIRARPFAWRGEPALLVTLNAAAFAAPSGAAEDAEAGIMEAKNHFLSRISHELRNTLATMKTAVYCLKESPDEKLTSQQAVMADMISRNVDRQTRLVENILDLARLRSGKLKIELHQADASKLIAELAAEFRLSRGARMLEVKVKDDLPLICCDPDLIAQVLRNLLDNAVRYARERISIEASRSGPDAVSFSVTDDGGGIPAEHLAGLFTLFQRLDRTEGPGAHKGTGLGLAICREIVEGHHGRITAENVPGAGARFRFELPVRAGAGPSRVTAASQRSDRAAMAAPGRRRI